MKVEIISCLQDNYSYLIIDETNNTACVVAVSYTHLTLPTKVRV